MTTNTATRPHRIKCSGGSYDCRGSHPTAADVANCYADAANQQAEAAAELWAEQAVERHLEGWYRLPDPDEGLDRMAEALGYGPPPGAF